MVKILANKLVWNEIKWQSNIITHFNPAYIPNTFGDISKAEITISVVIDSLIGWEIRRITSRCFLNNVAVEIAPPTSICQFSRTFRCTWPSRVSLVKKQSATNIWALPVGGRDFSSDEESGRGSWMCNYTVHALYIYQTRPGQQSAGRTRGRQQLKTTAVLWQGQEGRYIGIECQVTSKWHIVVVVCGQWTSMCWKSRS